MYYPDFRRDMEMARSMAMLIGAFTALVAVMFISVQFEGYEGLGVIVTVLPALVGIAVAYALIHLQASDHTRRISPVPLVVISIVIIAFSALVVDPITRFTFETDLAIQATWTAVGFAYVPLFITYCVCAWVTEMRRL